MIEGTEIIIEDLAVRHAVHTAKVKAVVGRHILVTYGLGDCFCELLHMDGDRIIAMNENDFWKTALERIDKEIDQARAQITHLELRRSIINNYTENAK